MPAAAAAETLLSCCGSTRWVRELVRRRPYESLAALLAAADAVWSRAAPNDWLEAFAQHPRIGAAPPPGAAGEDRSRRWSLAEQAQVALADAPTRADLADANRAYEARFGHVFLVFASGKTARDMLRLLRERMGNTPERELEIAAEEQRKITGARLAKLLRMEQSV
ncbi:MAG: 2-oxo-4-hydroxy-4-carboxy-5-ureidoimidazoline decarboxylase [Gemmatimonadaceae bacterium]